MGDVLSITDRTTLTIRPWIDPVVDANGFEPRSIEVEWDWLPVLGPTATLLYRRLGPWAAQNPDGLELIAADLASDLGLGHSAAPGSKLDKAIGRLVRFGAARWQGRALEVRRFLPTAPKRRSHDSSGDIA